MKNKLDNSAYYEHFDWEKSNLSVRLRSKIEKIFEFMPEDVKTIMDIGCGDGTITNELAKKYDVTGVDRSKTALSFVKTKKILSSSEKIDVPDKSFDMVFTSELLEHLENEVFYVTIKEIKRISKKYIFLTVLNNEVMDSMTSLTLFIAPHRLHFNGKKIAPHRLQYPKKCPFFSQKPEAVEWMQSNLGGKPY